VNPLAGPTDRWDEFYRRIKLIPWRLRYSSGDTREAILRDKIIELGAAMGLQDKWLSKIVRYAITEFTKKGLGADYESYHNIEHELEVAYFSLLAAKGQSRDQFSQEDIKYLFTAALFHDYDPSKGFDKPNEDSIEGFIRNDRNIRKFIADIGLDMDIVIALIHRTAYPFTGEIAEHAMQRISELLNSAGIPEQDTETRKHYEDLGWFLSIVDRVAGYALGDFEHGLELARRNALALHWHPSVMIERSVKYFSRLKEEEEMFNRVMLGIPEEFRRTFWNNVAAFKEEWNKELEVKNLTAKQLRLISVVEKNGSELEPQIRESVLNIYRGFPHHLRTDEETFTKSLHDRRVILITLRLNDVNGVIIGYAKGGPLESSRLRRGTHDENMGKSNTAYLEPINVKPGYWGGTGGHLLRLKFFQESTRCGYRFVTGYALRDVIVQRSERGENIQIVQKYNPDQLDYYRADLSDGGYQAMLLDISSIFVQQTQSA
jgi:hypothetical protein